MAGRINRLDSLRHLLCMVPGGKMCLAATPLGSEDEGLPGGEHHGLLRRGDAGEALQEGEEVILHVQRTRAHRREHRAHNPGPAGADQEHRGG